MSDTKLAPGLGVVVYVVSESSDDSVDLARGRRIAVAELDMGIRFTAAKARNTEFEYLLKLKPGLTLVQFLALDCEISEKWLEPNIRKLRTVPDVTAISRPCASDTPNCRLQ